jgi:hypothetical protein
MASSDENAGDKSGTGGSATGMQVLRPRAWKFLQRLPQPASGSSLALSCAGLKVTSKFIVPALRRK